MAEDTHNITVTIPRDNANDTHATSTRADIAEVVENVLDTNELLENILVRLPMKRLLLAQRVCKHWKALISGSIRLQRALFMVPVPISGQVLKLKRRRELLRGFTENSGFRYKYRFKEYWAQIDFHISERVIANSALCEVLYRPRPYWMQCNLQLKLHAARDNPAWQRPEASWRKMLLSQPPTEIWSTFPCINLFSENVVEGSKLVRAGDLVDSASSQWRALTTDPTVKPEDEEVSISGSSDWGLLDSIEDLEARLNSSH